MKKILVLAFFCLLVSGVNGQNNDNIDAFGIRYDGIYVGKTKRESLAHGYNNPNPYSRTYEATIINASFTSYYRFYKDGTVLYTQNPGQGSDNPFWLSKSNSSNNHVYVTEFGSSGSGWDLLYNAAGIIRETYTVTKGEIKFSSGYVNFIGKIHGDRICFKVRSKSYNNKLLKHIDAGNAILTLRKDRATFIHIPNIPD
jgi:hypothetical protein